MSNQPTQATRTFHCPLCGFSQVVPAHFPPVVCPICRGPENPPQRDGAKPRADRPAARGSVFLPTPHSPLPTF
jgi:hypothetical protein